MAKRSLIKLVASCLCTTAALSGSPVFARMQQFHASWEESSWQVDSSPQRCSMTHEIPRFGRARFEQHSGRRLEFALDVDQPPVRDHKVWLNSEVPPWKHQGENRSLGDFTIRQGKTPLQIPRDQALRIYYELEQGMKPVLEFSDWGDGQDQVKVALMPVRFREALPRFLECTASLMYLDFEPIGEKTVFFTTNSDRLNHSARRMLENIARDYRKQPDFRIVLGGHADERGDNEYNMDLSRRRAAIVSRFLRSRGVSAKAIESRYFGEAHPQDPENNEKAWSKNRRVTVWLADKTLTP